MDTSQTDLSVDDDHRMAGVEKRKGVLALIIGCNTVLFGSLDLKEALRYISLAGFEAAELRACMAQHVWPDFSEDKIAQTKEILDQSGLKIVAMEAVANLLEAEQREWFYSALRLAKALGVPLVTTGSGGKDNEEDLRQIEAAIPEVAAQAESIGVKWPSNPTYAAVHDVASALRMVEAAKSEWVGLNYDATHLYREGEDILAAWDRRAPHVIHIHFRDLLGGENKQIGPPINQVPGLGVLDLPALLKRIVASGYQGALDLEVIGASEYPGEESLGIAAQSGATSGAASKRSKGKSDPLTTQVARRASASESELLDGGDR